MANAVIDRLSKDPLFDIDEYDYYASILFDINEYDYVNSTYVWVITDIHQGLTDSMKEFLNGCENSKR